MSSSSTLGGTELDEALAVARRVVGEAAALLREAHAAGERIEPVQFKKNIRDPVTAWDTRVEDLIRERLARLLPGIPIIGEERGAGDPPPDDPLLVPHPPPAQSDRAAWPAAAAARGSSLRWLIDPIDGTVNFSHGLPLFGVTVSLEDGGRPVVGVIAAPALGWEVWGRLGGGAYAEDGRRLSVSRIAELERALVCTGFPYDRATSRKNFAEWEHLQCVAGACRRIGAASLDMAMVARGWLDAYWEADIEAWDLSAGALLVEEAGGQVTDITGEPFVSDTGRALATNGAIHNVMLDALAVARSLGART